MLGTKAHRQIYLVLLTLLGGSMVVSQGLTNVLWVSLAINWLLEGRWREKWQMAKASRLLQAIAVLWIAYMIGSFASGSLQEALTNLEIRSALAVVPLVILTTAPVEGRERKTILWLYVGTVTVVTMIAAVRLFTIDGLPYREAVPFTSHIRFALHCCMVIFFCLLEHPRGRWRWGAYAVAVWMMAFLFIIQSYTAMAMLAIVWPVLTIVYRRRWTLALVAVVAVGATMLIIGCRSYYRLIPMAQAPLRATTAGGRPYMHQQDGLIENGNYVNNYICLEELRSEWGRRSTARLDSMAANGHTLEPALIRYLNALGLPKDSVGVASMTESQIHDVEKGIANPVYAHDWVGKRMLYAMLYEYENYRCYRSVEGFTFLQRLAVWKAGWQLVMRNPWFGGGVCKLHHRVAEQLETMDSPLKGSGIHLHSQYLVWLVMFGFVGCAIVGFMFLRAAPSLRGQSPLLIAWVLVVMFSFSTEYTLGVVAERIFCTWFLAFRVAKRQKYGGEANKTN